MSETIFQFNFDIAGVPTDVTSAVFSNAAGTFGAIRNDTGAIVIADGTALTHVAVGQYSYTLTDPAYDLTYTYWVEFVYSGNTYRVERTVAGTATPTPATGPAIETVVTSGCGGAYAYAWEFSAFWCTASLLKRKHTGGGAAAVLTDSQTDFEAVGVMANVGMVLYNLTDGSSGEVTVVGQHTLTAILTGGTDNLWDTNDVYRIVLIDAQVIATIAQVLELAAADIHGALAASGACGCTLSTAGKRLVKKLNIIEAAAFYQCPCAKPSIADDFRQNLLAWAERQLELLRTGKLDICAGATGAEFPAIDWGEQSTTEFSSAQIIWNAQARE